MKNSRPVPILTTAPASHLHRIHLHLFRNHSSKGSTRQEPWLFGEETLNINRKYIELRYKLLPYLYDLFHETEQNGMPVIRPLVLHYEKDKETWNLNGEFLFGAAYAGSR